jgi:hypothetical protein
MSLDKFFNQTKETREKKLDLPVASKPVTGDNKPASGEKPEPVVVKPSLPNTKPASPAYIKYNLVCTNSNCKYKRLVVKARLTVRDMVCPKCDGEMVEGKNAGSGNKKKQIKKAHKYVSG